MKRGNRETGHNVSKKPKIELRGMARTAVGRGHNIDQRHARQLQSLISLILSNKSPLQVTDDRSDVLLKTGSSMGIYMEWFKKKDAYFLWGSTAEEGIMIKFEFHGGLEAEAGLFDIKNPLIGFSDGFNSDNWKDVKHMLLKVFEPKDGERPQHDPDYLLAFTQTGEILHLRVFKILQLPASSKQQSIKLQCVCPVFILKPLEIHRRDVAGGAERYTRTSTFFDENQFMFAESENSFDLDQHIVYSGGSSHPVASHVLHNYNSLVVVLPLPANCSWIGFNTSCKEFFERYHAVKDVPVPGQGPPRKLGTKVVYTCPMRVFMRSLVMEVGEAFGRECCFSDFTVENIFVRRGRARILGVKQVPYNTEQARRNWSVIYNLMVVTSTTGMPAEVISGAFRLMAIALSALVDPRSICPLLVNSFSWMDALSKHHMISDLYTEFLTFLDPKAQLTVVEEFPYLNGWEKRVDSNNLLYSVRVNNLDQNCIYDASAYQAWKEEKANALNAYWGLSEEKAKVLFNGRLLFGNMRHSYTHLPDHGLKARIPLKLPPEQVDTIVSCSLGELGASVQTNIPLAYSNNDQKRSYERFSSYFQCVDEVEFDSEDEK